jgi:hypothetical protein
MAGDGVRRQVGLRPGAGGDRRRRTGVPASIFRWFSASYAGISANTSAWNTGIGSRLPVLMLMVAA